MGDNIFATGMAAFGDAYDQQNKMRTDRAKVQAGRRLSAGDYTGAAGELAQGGDVGGAVDLQAQARALQDRQSNIKAATSYANGDTNGAMNAIAQTGDIRNVDALHQQIMAQHKQQLDFGAAQAAKLKNVKDTAGAPAMMQAFEQQVPLYRQMGTSEDQINQLRQGLQTNPDAVLNAIANPPELDYHTAGDTLFVSNKATGQLVGQHSGSKFMTVGPFDKVIDAGSSGQQGATPQAAPAPMQGAGGDPSQPRGLRNNNPLNLTSLPHGQWDGQTGTDGKYAVFATPEQGLAAADKNLQAYATHHGINTLAGVISRWAPSSENDTKAYIGTASQNLGVDPNTPLNLADPNVRMHVLEAMAHVELGKAMPQTGAQAASPAQPQGGPRVIYDGTAGAGAGGLTGPAYLQSLPPSMQSQVKAIAEGRMAISPMMMRSPAGAQIISAVAQYDPTFNQGDANARFAAEKDRTSGKLAQNITSMNTAIGHMGSLMKAIDGLNTNGVPVNNYAARLIAHATGTDERFAPFDAEKKAVADELTRVFRGTGGSEGDIQSFLGQLDSAKNPATLKATVRTLAELLQSRLDAAGDQYRKAMNVQDLTTILSPKAQTTLAQIRGQGASGAAQPAQASQAPAIIRYDAQGNRIG